MKRITLVLIAMVSFVFVANAAQDRAPISGDSGNTVLVSVSDDSQTSSELTFYNNSTKSITVCVRVYNGRNEVGSGCFDIPGASAQGSHYECTKTLNKTKGCGMASSGCEVTRIEITSANVN